MKRTFRLFDSLEAADRADAERDAISPPRSASKSFSTFKRSATLMQLHKDLREFVELLNSNEVEYVVVGAHAVAYHGYPRYTGDPDSGVTPSYANKESTVRAKELGDAEETTKTFPALSSRARRRARADGAAKPRTGGRSWSCRWSELRCEARFAPGSTSSKSNAVRLYDPKLSVRNTIDKRQRGSLHERQDRVLVLTLETNHDDPGVRDRIIRLNVGKSEIERNENAPFRFGLLS